MNINIYIENELAEELEVLTVAEGKSRNRLIRDAIKAYVAQHGSQSWPESVREFTGVKAAPSFEQYRDELKDEDEDLF